jgi:alkylated DNA repair dioxygenase AlkB
MDIKIIPEEDSTYSIFIYIANFLDTTQEHVLLQQLEGMGDFQENRNYTEDKTIRLQKWYQMNGHYFCPKWKVHYDRWKSHTYPEFLLKLQTEVQQYMMTSPNLEYIIRDKLTIPSINSCLINKYRNGEDYIRPHRDTDISFGKEPTILGLSLGNNRDMIFRRVKYSGHNCNNSKKDHNKKNLDFTQTLESGSLFIMAGTSQKYFTHEIPKKIDSGIRYSLTFREFKI